MYVWRDIQMGDMFYLCARPAMSRSTNEGVVDRCSSSSARDARSRSTNDGASDMVSSSSSALRSCCLLRPWAMTRELRGWPRKESVRDTLNRITSKVEPADAKAKSNQNATVGVGSDSCVAFGPWAPDASSTHFTCNISVFRWSGAECTGIAAGDAVVQANGIGDGGRRAVTDVDGASDGGGAEDSGCSSGGDGGDGGGGGGGGGWPCTGRGGAGERRGRAIGGAGDGGGGDHDPGLRRESVLGSMALFEQVQVGPFRRTSSPTPGAGSTKSWKWYAPGAVSGGGCARNNNCELRSAAAALSISRARQPGGNNLMDVERTPARAITCPLVTSPENVASRVAPQTHEDNAMEKRASPPRRSGGPFSRGCNAPHPA